MSRAAKRLSQFHGRAYATSPTLAEVSDGAGGMKDRIEKAQTGSQVQRDPVVEAYKRDVDRSLLRENLRRSPTERVTNLAALQRLAKEAQRPGRFRDQPH